MDILTPQKRSWIMSRIHDRDTRPELLVRSAIHRMGFRFRLRGRDLPGKPDIVLPRFKKVIFVHGCFWHQHQGCASAKRPRTNKKFWNQKLDVNIARDKEASKECRKMGWKVLILWECEIERKQRLIRRLQKFLL